MYELAKTLAAQLLMPLPLCLGLMGLGTLLLRCRYRRAGWRPSAPWSSTARLNDSSAIRLMEGKRLWRQAPDLPLIVTGASRDPEEAPIAQGYGDAAGRELSMFQFALVGLPVALISLGVLLWRASSLPSHPAENTRDRLVYSSALPIPQVSSC
ncbi:hypothetical protein GCM10022228_06920 [Halomonas cibimaris]|uniref:Uncharacterized protein n=1 Tax=Halomonas cibimaris TaxID=657012 RepID=A0ABP7LCD6_9GAMM